MSIREFRQAMQYPTMENLFIAFEELREKGKKHPEQLSDIEVAALADWFWKCKDVKEIQHQRMVKSYPQLLLKPSNHLKSILKLKKIYAHTAWISILLLSVFWWSFEHPSANLTPFSHEVVTDLSLISTCLLGTIFVLPVFFTWLLARAELYVFHIIDCIQHSRPVEPYQHPKYIPTSYLSSYKARQISGPFYFGGTILLPVAIILLLINQKLPSNELSSLAKFTWVYMSVCVLVFWHLQYIFIHNRVIGYVCSLISFVTFLLFSMRLVFSPM